MSDLEWLLRVGQRTTSFPTFVEQFCQFLHATGVPLGRATINVRILHPLLVGRGYRWHPDRPLTEILYGREQIADQAFLQSPIRRAVEGVMTRARLAEPPAATDFSILHDLYAEGFTDYVALPIDTEPRSFVTFASRAAGGFTDLQINRLCELLPMLAMVLTKYATQLVAESALTTYLGRDAGQRVMGGRITRGEYDRLRAVICLADLRGFSLLSERTDAGAVVGLLNEYFDLVGGALVAEGGEILKFIGDAVLGVFVLPADDPQPACDAALRAARNAMAALEARSRDAEAGPPFRFGLALHMGEVVYGNIGTADRLDFTVIGPAVNRAARIAELCKALDTPVLVSGEVARHASVGLQSLGRHALRGLGDDVELLTFPVDGAEPP